MAICGLGVVEDIRPGEVDVRAGQVDFHIDVVRRRGRVDVNDRFIVRVVHEPADAVGVDSVGRIDLPWMLANPKICDRSM